MDGNRYDNSMDLGLDREGARQRIEELRRTLRHNSDLYYIHNAPQISDYEYDRLMHRLEDLESRFPEFASADSPTQKVGTDLSDRPMEGPSAAQPREFDQLPHRYPMLSLSNTYSIGEVEDFAMRASRSLDQEFTYCCELKFDGTAICLTYKDGRLARALTRGDGQVGDDVTRNVLRISNIPTRLHGTGYPDEFEIRGEILMPYSSFEALNEKRIAEGEQPFANPRNAAAGSLKLLDPEEVGRRGLFCTLYHIPSGNIGLSTHDETLSAAASWGLPVSGERKVCRNIDEIEQFISRWDVERKKLPFPTDGIVIKINELALQTRLGYTAKFPRWAVAYKFKAEDALTRLLSIDYQVGRTGAVTPVANMEPVLLAGTVVRRATLNNEDQMLSMDIRIGDWVHVEKGGEIIPKITSVEKSRRTGEETVPSFPVRCPVCGTPLEREEGEAKSFCPNVYLCPPQLKGRILHFMGRKAMNIEAGEATVSQLYDKGLARTPADLYDLTRTQLLGLDKWKDKSADNFLASLSASKGTPFDKVLFALGIRYVGESTAKELASHFGDMDSIAAASVEDLMGVPDVGETIARSVHSFFRTPSLAEEVERLRRAGLNFSMQKKVVVAGARPLDSMSIVVSGTFSEGGREIRRDDIKKMIEDAGGKSPGSVSGKTTYLLAGENPGPEKIRKCTELGIPVIGYGRFLELIGRTVEPVSATDEGENDGEEAFEGSLFPGM